MKRIGKISITFFFLANWLFAQSSAIKFERLSTEHGLSHSSVYCICQDRKGFLWFGTENGLNRYDGYEFKKYFHVPGDFTSLSNSYVWSIVEDHTGILWVGTVDGLNKFDPSTETFKHYKHDPADSTSLSYSYVRVVYEDHAGTLWVGTTNGVSRFDRGTETFRSYNRDESGEDMDETYTLSIYEDHEHKLWIGTGDGLFRFDRQRDRLVRDEVWDVFSSPSKSVTAIFQDAADTYWFGGFGSGVTQRIAKSNDFKRPPSESALPQSGAVRAFCSDNAGNVLGAWSQGLFYFNSRNGVTTDYIHGSGEFARIGRLMDVMFDSSGVIWAGGYGGIYKLYPQTKRFKQYHPAKPNDGISPDRKRITAITMNGSGQVWLATQDIGAYKIDREGERIEHLGNVPELLCSLYVDKDGTVWLGGFSWAACYGRAWHETALTFSVNMRRATDAQGKVLAAVDNVVLAGSHPPLQWPAANWPGNDRDKFIFLNDSGRDGDEIADDGIWSKAVIFPVFAPLTIQYKYGANWSPRSSYGTNDNEAGYGDDHFIHLSSEIRTGIVRNVFGKMGFAEVTETEMRDDIKAVKAPIRRERILRFPAFQELNTWGYVNAFFEDRNGVFWIATDGAGLKKYDRNNEKVIKSYERDPSEASSLSSNKCKMIFEDASGFLWIATWGGGLNKYDRLTDSFVHYRHDPNNPSSLSDDRVMALYETPKGVLWIGTSSGGINRFDMAAKAFKHFTMDDGLPSNNIYAISGDDSGNLWISTDNGLSKMDIEHGTFRNYDTKDGLPTTEFNERAWFKSKKGELFFGAQDKLIAFFPDSIRDNSFIPPLVLTNFKIMNKPVELDTAIAEKKHIVLRHDENFLSFEFAALNYVSPEKNQYSYKMEGVDKDWIHSGTRRFANYTSIDPGEYVFKVRGSNNDGVWNEKGASVRITINPPWWRTNWAYAIYALLIGTAFYVLRRLERHRFRTLNELEKQRFEAQKLLELDQAKSRFFANISHEFRTPLTLILGPVEQMLAKTGEEDGRQNLSMIQRNARRLLQLINQLLDLSKLETGRMKLQARAEEAKSILRIQVLAFVSLAERKKITLKFDEPDEEIIAYLDRDKFEKLIANLLSNAFKFTPEGGKIEVAVAVGSENDEGTREKGEGSGALLRSKFLQITVRDTGIGMPADQLTHIFDRFYQVDNSHTREHEGTGIGLALVKELVELHGGKILVESELLEGSVFTVLVPLGRAHLRDEEIVESSERLPVTSDQLPVISDQHQAVSGEDQATSSEPPATLRRTGKKPFILIIDDNSDVRRYIRSHLDPDYHIIEAADGAEGLQKAIEKMPDLIISDVMMPKMDGIELCRQVKTDERTSHIPVILLTARASGESKVEGLETGADDYITKPFDAKELQVRAKNLIEQRRKLRERFRREMTLQPREVTVNSMDEQFLQRALDIVEQHIDDTEFGVEIFSKKIGMSRQHLNRKLHALTAHAANDFIRTIRLKRAAQLLEKRSATVTEIAYEVGFNNPAYFAECFRKEFGRSPSQYARS